MALDINALRSAFTKKSTEGGSNTENNGFWEKFYPFFKMDFDETCDVRFLPDLDEENPIGFIVENRYHELLINGKKKKIACSQMYGEECQCCNESKAHYDAGDEKLGKALWRKIDYIAQIVVNKSPFDYPIKDEENPVRLISLSTKLYKVIESKIIKGDMEDMPCDMEVGYNFRINKTKQGEWADYTTSDFARKSTAVLEKFVDRIELYDLKAYRHCKIEADQMATMIDAFMTGRSYEAEKVTPSSQSSTGSSTLDDKMESPKTTRDADTVVNEVKESAPAASNGGKLSPQEILKKLKERQQANA